MQAIFTHLTLVSVGITLRAIVDNPDAFIPQLIRNQFDDARWNQAFDATLKRFQALQQGMVARQRRIEP